jgi:hypothetical protein
MKEPPPWLQKELTQQHFLNTYTLEKAFTSQELNKSLVKSKNSSAPGKDGIPTAALKYAIIHAPEDETNHVSEILLAIAQAIYDAEGKHKITKQIVCKPLYKTQGVKDLQTYAQSHSRTQSSKMLATRLASDLFQNGVIHTANEAFLKGRNTGNTLTTILNIWEDAKAKNKPCYCVSYDQAKAYDHLRWFTIKHGMERLNLFSNRILTLTHQVHTRATPAASAKCLYHELLASENGDLGQCPHRKRPSLRTCLGFFFF